jgi:hypothetical protein
MEERKRSGGEIIKISRASFFLLQFSLPSFSSPPSDEWKMDLSLKRQLQRSLIKNKSVPFINSRSTAEAQWENIISLSFANAGRYRLENPLEIKPSKRMTRVWSMNYARCLVDLWRLKLASRWSREWPSPIEFSAIEIISLGKVLFVV